MNNYPILFFQLIVTLLIVIFQLCKAVVFFFIPNNMKFMKVENKIVLITGSGSGLGAALAVKFAQRKARLVLWDLDTKGLEKVSDECKKYQSETAIATYKVDVTNREEVMNTAAKIKNSIGYVDILINNAGIVSGKQLLEIDENTVKKVLDVNVVSHFWTVQAFLPDMMKRKCGDIVSIASIGGLQSVYKLSDYNASKFAAVGFQEALLNEMHYTGHGSDINCLTVCPFYINTGMFDGVTSKNPLLPILELSYASTKIEEAILLRSKFLVMPRIAYFLLVLKSILPVDATMALLDYFGCNQGMECFKGRTKSS